MNCDLAKSHVFPYVDGELTRELREEMNAHLSGCAACRRLVDQERAFQGAYVARLRPDPAPPELRQKVDRLLDGLVVAEHRRRRMRSAPWIYVAAAAVLLAVGVTVGVGVQSVRQRSHMLAELAEASVDQHQKLVRGVLPPDIAGISPKAAEHWFRKRLDFNVSLPELNSADLQLRGARISHLANIEVAALEYQLDQEHVSLFIIPEDAYKRLGLSEKPKFKVLSHRGYDVIIWRHHNSAYTLVSEIGARACLVCHSPGDKVEGALQSPARL
jgi:anti-sigma factor (TIGR02949 family)